MREHAVVLGEKVAEVRRLAEAQRKGDFLDAERRVVEQPLGLGVEPLLHAGARRFAGPGFANPVELLDRHRQERRVLLHRVVLLVVRIEQLPEPVRFRSA